MRNVWVWFVVVVVGILGLLFWISSKSPAGNTTKIPLAEGAILATDWKTGSTTASVQLVEFSDFQCPACAAYFPMVEQLIAEYKDRILFVYKHYPLPQHPNAKIAAYAAEAAGKQGKFFEMYRAIFSHQNDWAEKNNTLAQAMFDSYASALGINMTQFKKDAASSEIKDKVDRDALIGNQSQVSYTPSFFLNGYLIENPQSYDAFKQVIDQALNAQK